MIRIGFDDDVANDVNYYDSEEEETEKLHGRRFARPERKEVYLSPERLEAVQREMNSVVVRDFGDEYHLTEEERRAKNKYYDTFKALKKAKKKYRRINEFVQVMRQALHCLDVVAESNGIYEPEDFKIKFLRGEIYINGLKFPKYNGKNRKDISWEYLSEFILSDKDPSELLPSRNDDEILTDEELKRNEEQLFEKGELERIFAPETAEEEHERNVFFDVDTDSQDGKSIAVYLSKKQVKKFMKSQPEFMHEIRDIKREQSAVSHLDQYAYDLTQDDFRSIERYDRKHGYETSSQMPEFKGDIMNDDDYNRYMLKLKEYEEDHVKESYAGRMKTLGEIRELEIKELLEESGWNIRALYNNKEKEKKLKKAIERDKKREKQLKRQLRKVQSRNKNRRMNDDDSKKKKKKKKKKKDYD